MLDLSKIEAVIFDLDQTLYPYWAGVADAFSFYTAREARVMMIEKGMEDIPEEKDLESLAQHSYSVYGTTCREFMLRYGLDEKQLYQRHHSRMLNEFIKPQWDEHCGIDEALTSSLHDLKNSGRRLFVFTNGTTEWAQEILELRGLKGIFEAVAGTDDLPMKSDHDAFYAFACRYGITPRQKAVWDNILNVEDTPVNLRDPKRVFKMQSALIYTDRINPLLFDCSYIDGFFFTAGSAAKFVANVPKVV